MNHKPNEAGKLLGNGDIVIVLRPCVLIAEHGEVGVVVDAPQSMPGQQGSKVLITARGYIVVEEADVEPTGKSLAGATFETCNAARARGSLQQALVDGKLPETTLSDTEWERFERAGYNAIQRLDFDLGIEGDDDAKVRSLLVSLQAYCVTYAVDLEARLVEVREQIASGDLQSPRWGEWVKLPEVAPGAGTPDQPRDHAEKALAGPHAAEIRSDYMDASGDVAANATVSGLAPVSADVPDLLKALQTLVPHVLHYAAMPAAHSDAHRDAANARAVIANAIAHQHASTSK